MIKKKCLVCGKEIYSFPSRIKKGQDKYCSRECSNKEKIGKPIHSEEHKKELSKKFKGRVSPNKGNKFSEEILNKMRGRDPWNKGTKGIMKPNKASFRKGQKAWNKGIPFSEEVRKKMSQNKRDEKNHGWKGDEANKGTIHDWVRTRKGRASEHKCGICKEKQAMDWSNKDHKYKRNLDDWQAVCRKCHYWYDYKYNNKRMPKASKYTIV